MTITRMLQQQAAHQPANLAFRFLRDGGAAELTLTFQETDAQARCIAAALQARTDEGDRVLLVYPAGLEFVSAFFGSLYAGTVGVPVPVPHQNRSLDRLRAIVVDAQPRLVLTTAGMRDLLWRRSPEMPELLSIEWLLTDELGAAGAGKWQDRQPSGDMLADTLAYLQYTSGSTTVPRGVMVSHRNITHNLGLIRQACEFNAQTSLVFWLPHHHDMGLGALMLPVFGCPLTFMAPASFVQRPYRWLEAITRFRGTLTAAPNSAYDLCVRSIGAEQRAKLDLSSLRFALNGAEPVRAETLDRFAEAFASCGFRREAFFPTYGLAEARLYVSGAKGAGSPARTLCLQKRGLQEDRVIESQPGNSGALNLVSCGRIAEGLRVCIVEPGSRELCSDGRIGEIWIAGESVALGYWNRPEESQGTFRAQLAGKPQEHYLRTGDMGFIERGELFVTGRLKDLLIIWGRNHYPQDIEATIASCHASLRSGVSAAFSVDRDGEESVVIVAETPRRFSAGEVPVVIAAIRRDVAEAHEVDVAAVRLVEWGSLPRTTSGKIQRHLCRAAFLEETLNVVGEWTRPQRRGSADDRRPASSDESASRAKAIMAWIVAKIAERTGTAPDEIDVTRPFASLGLDSLSALRLAGDLEQWLGEDISPTLIYEHVNIAALAEHLASAATLSAPATAGKPMRASRANAGPIAIIGLGCRFPGANGPEAYWQMLKGGVDAISEVPPERWRANQFFDERPLTPGKMNTRWGGFLDRVDLFDPAFFKISPREAANMDPQQRLLLEVAWEALEDAGQTRDELAGTPVGVFIGISHSEYGALQIAAPERIDAYWSTGNALSIAANRISYLFDFRGPSLAVDTACSSSLVAIHLACQSLRRGESTVALAGGVNLILTPTITINFSMGGGTSPDGRCKPFDARANGMVRGEGAGIVVLKPLDQALLDNDPIHAVILGSAINQDGSTNGIVAPSRVAQEEVLRSAYHDAGVEPAAVHYVEAHGTGTYLGDPIEAAALGNVVGRNRPEAKTFAIGSVKSNIGHLEAAAGVAGLIKVVLSLQHRQIPASLHFNKLNPHINFDSVRARVQQSLDDWPEDQGPAIAGVSAFGFGGTNAHAVLRSAPDRKEDGTPTTQHAWILPLSAHSGAALRSLAKAYREKLNESLGRASLHDLCYTASVCRNHHDYRAALVFSSREEMVAQLEQLASGKTADGVTVGRSVPGRTPQIAFVFSGHGSQWWGMAQRLLAEEPRFREVIERCDELLRPFVAWSLVRELTAGEHDSRVDANSDHSSLEIAQVALFAFQVALADLLRSWGVQPTAVIGHSMGEVAAAHVAGTLSLADALRVIFHRSHLLQERLDDGSASGAMALVRLSRSEAEQAVADYGGRVSLAAHNAPKVTVLSGDAAALGELLESLKKRGIASRLALVPGAGHSPQIEPLRDQLVAILGSANGAASLRASPSKAQIFSTVTGKAEAGTTFDASYWGRNLREPVLFAEAVSEAARSGITHFLEISPEPLLVSAIQQCLRQVEHEAKSLVTLRRNHPERAALARTLGQLYADGYPVSWSRLYSTGSCVCLPAYPWQRERYWLSWPSFASAAKEELPAREDPESFFYHLSWEVAPKVEARNAIGSWIVFADRGAVAAELRGLLQQQGGACEVVFPGDDFRQVASGEWQIDPECPEHFDRLLAEVQPAETPRGIVHMWGLEAGASEPGDPSFRERARSLGCTSTLHLIQALGRRKQSPSVQLWLVTAGAQALQPGPTIALEQAALWGLGRVIHFEHPELRCRMVDLSPQHFAREIPALVDALARDDYEDHIAIRNGAQHRARLARGIPTADPSTARAPGFKPDASYVIVGGLGGLGLVTAQWMVEHGARYVALVGRRPPSAAATDVVARLEAKGARVRTFQADVVNQSDMAWVLAEIRKEMPLHGIVHAAAHLDDGLLRHLDRQRFDAVMAPKVHGAWNLHSLTVNDGLDFFVMFSSIASLIGSPGQGNYAAANAFLDALAHHRSAQGMPALSINWGPWSHVGGADRPDRGGRLAQIGFESITPEQGLNALGALLFQSAPQVAVMPVSWSNVRKAYPGVAQWPLLASLWESRTAASAWMPDLDRDRNLPRGDLADLSLLEEDFVAPRTPMEEQLAALWMQVSGARRVSVRDDFLKLGGDSLMAVQLLSHISALTKREVSIQLLTSNPTIELLAKALEGAALATPGVASVSPAATSADFPMEHRPLLSLSMTGNLKPVGAAALCYLSQSYLARCGLQADDVADNWCHNLPAYIDRIETVLGSIALILLPVREADLYSNTPLLVRTVVEALEMAKQVGARSASLMGLLPSASDFGRAIAQVTAERSLPSITTGHATTAAAVVLNLAGILASAGRDLSGEHVAFLGMGSVGKSTLRLMLRSLPRPASLVLCDVYAKREQLERVRDEIVSLWGEADRVTIAESGRGAPDQIYECSVIVGATNVPDIVDIERVKPGTLLVDDSAPHCFRPSAAIKRFEREADILFTEGGMMKSPQAVNHLVYVPRSAHAVVAGAFLSKMSPYHIPGCILSSLLSFNFEGLTPTIGAVDTDNSVRHYDALVKLGFAAGDLHCEDYALAPDAISAFRRRFAGR
ncbi:MAG: SDR family NAD(P)-dependent oxidoreductase [Gammaproteobacteria bacterium]